jgi:flagellar basal-body rod modification protein FlgD
MTTSPVGSSFAAFAASTQRKDSAANAKATSTTGVDLTGGSGGVATQQMFLQLLVAQLKNQDPMQPTDGTQFVAQLAQFSELEQVIAIRQNTDTMKAAGTTTGK